MYMRFCFPEIKFYGKLIINEYRLHIYSLKLYRSLILYYCPMSLFIYKWGGDFQISIYLNYVRRELFSYNYL